MLTKPTPGTPVAYCRIPAELRRADATWEECAEGADAIVRDLFQQRLSREERESWARIEAGKIRRGLIWRGCRSASKSSIR